ncbi:CobW family GTP-binding protein [Salinispira pacifica]|uniref:Putative metal chaperone, involved in Zn homeostasis, GTPase of COG0523 family n=1 Tax=Salinispira pacifica TaxID=1307761 RepID=V5WI12_9SPIO|nr:GTP-binding protein [Salinispira pacifica]AHC15433.1 Putative metal chaperone, involved in Zn homeostasis, GTPase of COG0523 family [Salinispira pacifica]
MKTNEHQSGRAKSPIPALILSGFLGSGKTTLFRKLLAQAHKRRLDVRAIVNDMSELDIDGELIGNTGIIEANASLLRSISSVVLSSEKGIAMLDQAIEELLSDGNPDLLIIETSGSCHPMPLIEYFQNESRLMLCGVCVLVDSLMLSHDYDDGRGLFPAMQKNVVTQVRGTVNLLVEQIMFCSHIMFSKADRLQDAQFQNIVSSVQEINPYVPAFSLHYGNYPLEAILELPEYDYHRVSRLMDEIRPAVAADAKSDRPFDLAARVIKDDRPFHPQRLWEVCHTLLDKRIHRSKGFFWLASRSKHSLLWNQSAGGITLGINGSWRAGIAEDENPGVSSYEIEILKKRLKAEGNRFGDRCCDITVIGDAAHVDRFAEALQSCFLSDEEIELWKNGHEFEDPWPKNLVDMAY